MQPPEWHLWTPEQIVDALPELLDTVAGRLADFSAEYQARNRAAVEALTPSPPTASQIRDGSRSRDLVTLGFALDVLGRRAEEAGDVEESLRLFQAAHELFRGGNPLMRATRPMRQTLGNAVRALTQHELARVATGETTVATLSEALRAFVESAWGFVPAQVALTINETLVGELERLRAAAEPDPDRHERFVQDNLEAVLAMELPTRLQAVRQHWEEIGRAVAPAVTRRAVRAARRPEPLGSLVGHAVWSAIRQAVERGDPTALGQALQDVEDSLDTNLRLRLDAEAAYREPAAELRAGGSTDVAFAHARSLLLRRDPAALDQFSDVHYRRSDNPIAKEWYAYALTVFGHATDIHDIVELLEDAIASDHFRLDRSWTARWNLACALRRLPSRAHEALDLLLPVLEQDIHPADLLELCLLWALEQDRQDVLPSLLARARHHEAHLLLALREVEGGASTLDAARLREHFRRINRILRDPDRVFPDPREHLTFEELARLAREFVESSLTAAGVEWFRQRVSYGSEGRVFKNWECAAALNEAIGDLAGAWRCRLQSWRVTRYKKNVDVRRKTQALRALLAWAQRHGFHDDALRILRQSWRDTTMSDADARLWEQRLARAVAGPVGDAMTDSMAEPVAEPVAAARSLPDPAPARTEPPGPPRRGSTRVPEQALALMLDWENIKLSLADRLEELPEPRAQALRARLGGAELANRLLDAAWRHGTPLQRWAVADWDRPAFEGDQKAVKSNRFWLDIAGGDKPNASDHVLREKIHHVLRAYPEIPVYVIGTGDGDFHEVIRTLQEAGKQVIIWATRRGISAVYGDSLRGPDRIRIEWLEDLVFGDDALE